jgi:hypothetical protein
MTFCPDCSKRFEDGDYDGVMVRMFPALDRELDPDGLGKCVACWQAAAISHIRIASAVHQEFRSQGRPSSHAPTRQ